MIITFSEIPQEEMSDFTKKMRTTSYSKLLI